MKKKPTDWTTRYAQDVTDGKTIAGRMVRQACARHLKDLKEGHKRGLHFDVEAATRVFKFFATLRLTEGESDGKPFLLEPSQKFIVGSLFGWKTKDGTRRFRTAYIEQGKGNGKALALDTPIPTPTGWSDMGSLRVGDEVFDEHGTPCRVIGVTPAMLDRQCYRVGFSDHTSIVADARHEWRVSSLRTGCKMGPKPLSAQRKGGYAIRDTEDIAKTYLMAESTSLHPQAKYNHRIDVAGPLQTKDADLPIPPYTFGAWLGDGNTDDARITASYLDQGILDEIRMEGVSVQERPSSNKNTGRYILGSGGRTQACRNVSMQASLRTLGVLHHKHIPTIYLRAGESQRMALLQGLMDTDGCASSLQGACEYTTTDPLLRDGVMELVRTLGFKPVCGTGRATIYGKDCGEKYRILFMSHAHRPVFRLKRKIERMKLKTITRSLSAGRMIVSCEQVESVPVLCITVDSPSHLFLAGESMVPTHNSPLAAGIGLYGLTADGENGAEIYSAAVSRDQAKILFRDAENMVQTSPDLRDHIERHVGNLSVPSSFSYFRPVSSEHRGLDGKRVHMALIDEVHVHPDSLVVDKMRAGTKGRRQALIFLITNSGTDRNSVCWHYHEMSRKVVSGEIDNDSFFAHVCQLDACAACFADGKTLPVDGCMQCDDWRDEKTWIKANPCLGVSIKTRYLAEQVQEAMQMPSKENIVKRLNFCIWTEQSVRWMPMAAWDECSTEIPYTRLIGETCYAGLDLASRTDLCALVLVFPNIDGRCVALPYFWAPREGAERRQEVDHVPYMDWYRQGLIELTAGNATDYDVIREKVKELNETFRIIELGFDPWNAQQLCTQLTDDGITVVEIRQNFANLTGPMKELESLVKTKALAHGGHPIMRWMASNVSATMDKKGNISPSKERYIDKIDGIVALIMAISRSMLNQDPTSVYASRGVLIL